MEDTQMDIRERLVRLETRVDAIASQMATKADLAALEATLLKWFIGTALALTAIVFAAARLIK
jgi:hypothetical protein